MKTVFKLFVATAFIMGFNSLSVAQERTKKAKELHAEKILPFSADRVWSILGEDYGAVANSHPKIVSSSYINGTLKAEEGAERQCNFNDKGTRFLKEKIVDYDPLNYSFTNTIFQAGRFPVDHENTIGYWKVIPISEHTSKIVFDAKLRAKPAMMSGMMKSQFKKLIADYFIAIEHHLAKGENVTKENFKQIKKLYVSR